MLRAEGFPAAVTDGFRVRHDRTAGDFLEIVGRQIADGFLVELELFDLLLHDLPPTNIVENVLPHRPGSVPPVNMAGLLFVILNGNHLLWKSLQPS